MYFTLTKINLNLTILEDPPCKAIMSPPKIFGENHAIVFVSKNEFVFFFLRKKKKKLNKTFISLYTGTVVCMVSIRIRLFFYFLFWVHDFRVLYKNLL